MALCSARVVDVSWPITVQRSVKLNTGQHTRKLATSQSKHRYQVHCLLSTTASTRVTPKRNRGLCIQRSLECGCTRNTVASRGFGQKGQCTVFNTVLCLWQAQANFCPLQHRVPELRNRNKLNFCALHYFQTNLLDRNRSNRSRILAEDAPMPN